MRKLHMITLEGDSHIWSLETFIDPAVADDWRDDGIEIYELANIIPEWVVDLGLTRVWCFFQDVWNLR